MVITQSKCIFRVVDYLLFKILKGRQHHKNDFITLIVIRQIPISFSSLLFYYYYFFLQYITFIKPFFIH